MNHQTVTSTWIFNYCDKHIFKAFVQEIINMCDYLWYSTRRWLKEIYIYICICFLFLVSSYRNKEVVSDWKGDSRDS